MNSPTTTITNSPTPTRDKCSCDRLAELLLVALVLTVLLNGYLLYVVYFNEVLEPVFKVSLAACGIQAFLFYICSAYLALARDMSVVFRVLGGLLMVLLPVVLFAYRWDMREGVRQGLASVLAASYLALAVSHKAENLDAVVGGLRYVYWDAWR